MGSPRNRAKNPGFRQTTPTPIARGLLWLASLAICLACSSGNDLALLPLRDVEIDEDASLLYVRGEGFVPGARCQAELIGQSHPLGRRAERVALEVPCRVLTDERCVLALTDPVLRDRPRGFFEGTLSIRLSARKSQRAVAGSLDSVRIRLGTYGKAGVDDALSLARGARAFQHRIGLRGVESSARGLVVTALDEPGLFAQSGGRVGDVVQRIDSAPLEIPDDLIAPEQAARTKLRLSRRGQGPFEVTLSLGAREPPLPLFLFGAMLIAAVCASTLPGTPVASRNARLGVAGVALTCAALAWLLVGLVQGHLHAGLVWVTALVVHGFLLVAGHARGHRNTLTLSRDALDLAVPSVAVSALCLVAGNLTLPLFADDLPLSLALVGTPAGLCACLALYFGLLSTRPDDLPTASFVRASGALLVALLGFGAGGISTWLDPSGGPVAKTVGALAVVAIALALRCLPPANLRHPRMLAGVLALLALALAVLAPRSEALPVELGAALVLGFLGGRLVRLVLLRFGDHAPRDPALRPFL